MFRHALVGICALVLLLAARGAPRADELLQYRDLFNGRDLTGWVTGFGEVLAVGVEGTASWGAGVCRHLRARGINVIEVNQPDRHRRRRRGKSDRIDAEMAARAVLAGDATAVPKAGDGPVEACTSSA